ncbi:MAG: glycosyltransferase [Thermonemataceae bacterium]|nr:glycosyltransferase [Thermonemataceae bacterium]
MKEIDVSVLIPCFNEQENIPYLIETIDAFTKNNAHISWEFVFIDDGSKDNTWALLEKTCLEGVHLQLLQLAKNFGSHAALRAGISVARGRYTTFLYADLQDPIDLLLQLFEKIQKHKKEVVWAVRKQSQGIFSALYAFLMQKIVNKNFPSTGFDVVMFSRKVQKNLNNAIENESSLFLQILDFGFSDASITYQKQFRRLGKSKWTIKKKLALLLNSIFGFSIFPVYSIALIGFLFLLMAFGSIVYAVYTKNFTTWLLPIVLLLGFGFTQISLAMLGLYLWRSERKFAKPAFIIQNTIIKNANTLL